MQGGGLARALHRTANAACERETLPRLTGNGAAGGPPVYRLSVPAEVVAVELQWTPP